MLYHDYSWLSRDGLKLSGRSWFPAQKPEALILLIHGLGDHGGRYDAWARQFAEQGIAVATIDYRGHGTSEGKRGHCDSYDQLLDDIGILFEHSAAWFPGVPRILYGHSLGGGLVIQYAMKRKPSIEGLIATSPWLRLSFNPPKIQLFFGKIVRRILPSLSMSNGLNPSDLSHIPVVAGEYKKDPLVHGKITPSMFFSAIEAGEEAILGMRKIRIPVLIMHGSADKITSPSASQEFANHSDGQVTFRLWPDQFHELHHEPVSAEVFDYIHSWIRETLKQPSVKTGTNGYF